MRTILSSIILAGGGLLAVTVPAAGQEVNSDVNIPMPREIVTTVPAVSGLVPTPLIEQDPTIQSVLADDALANSSEATVRAQLGDFMASLLIKAGVITVEPQPVRVSSSGMKSQDGSRPAWTGRTPMALSVSRTGRSEVMRRR